MARIRHIAILTENVDKLVKFYTEGFGLKIVHGVGTATYLTDGHINLAIIPIGPEREIEGPQLQTGINHFGFEVEDVAAVREACNGRTNRCKKATAQSRSRIPRPRPRRQPCRSIPAWLAALRRGLPRTVCYEYPSVEERVI